MCDLNDRLSACAGLLWERNRLAVNEIVTDRGVSVTTATRLLHQLEELGMAKRGEDLAIGPGRPSATYELAIPHQTAACYVDGSQIWAGLVTSDLNVRSLVVADSDPAADVTAHVNRVYKLITSLDGFNSASAVAMSINAVILNGQILASSVVPHAHSMMLRLLEEQFDRPVHLSTAPLSACVSRQLSGTMNVENVLCYHIADGVSAHTQILGRPYVGTSGLAGEIGHLAVVSNDMLCGCGRRGCLETLVSGSAIRRRFLELLKYSPASILHNQIFDTTPPPKAINLIWNAWLSGDGLARGAMESVIDQLAWGLSIAVNLYDPGVVALSGYVLDGHDQWIEEIIRRARPDIMHEARREMRYEYVPIEPSNILREVAIATWYSKAVDRRTRA